MERRNIPINTSKIKTAHKRKETQQKKEDNN